MPGLLLVALIVNNGCESSGQGKLFSSGIYIVSLSIPSSSPVTVHIK